MSKVKLIALIGFIGLMGTEVFANEPSTSSEKNAYFRSAGSNKALKEYTLHSTHDATVKRKHNTSVKANQYIEISEQSENAITTNRKKGSVRSFNFSNGHEPLAAKTESKKTSPFRSIKWRR